MSSFCLVKRSKIHGTGVYAKKNIAEGTRVVEYIGEKITEKEFDKRADRDLENNAKDDDHGAVYLFQLNSRYYIDGNVNKNIARFINHSCDPNCETDIIRGHIWIVATRDIKKGEELFYNYSYGWGEHWEHICLCGSFKCVGYILEEASWLRLFRRLKRQTKRVLPTRKSAKKKTRR